MLVPIKANTMASKMVMTIYVMLESILSQWIFLCKYIIESKGSINEIGEINSIIGAIALTAYVIK